MRAITSEIASQPTLWRKAAAMAPAVIGRLPAPGEPAVAIGCGTSYHIARAYALLREGKGLWSFDSSKMDQLSNQYAAMPSLHCGWALWCVLALYPVVRPRWARVLLIVYPVATVFCIIVTANHYWLDAVGGVVTFTVGYFAAVRFTRWIHGHHGRRALTEA